MGSRIWLWPSIGPVGHARFESLYDRRFLDLLSGAARSRQKIGRCELRFAQGKLASPIAPLQADRQALVGASRERPPRIGGRRAGWARLVLARNARRIQSPHSRGLHIDFGRSHRNRPGPFGNRPGCEPDGRYDLPDFRGPREIGRVLFAGCTKRKSSACGLSLAGMHHLGCRISSQIASNRFKYDLSSSLRFNKNASMDFESDRERAEVSPVAWNSA